MRSFWNKQCILSAEFPPTLRERRSSWASSKTISKDFTYNATFYFV